MCDPNWQATYSMLTALIDPHLELA